MALLRSVSAGLLSYAGRPGRAISDVEFLIFSHVPGTRSRANVGMWW